MQLTQLTVLGPSVHVACFPLVNAQKSTSPGSLEAQLFGTSGGRPEAERRNRAGTTNRVIGHYDLLAVLLSKEY